MLQTFLFLEKTFLPQTIHHSHSLFILQAHFSQKPIYLFIYPYTKLRSPLKRSYSKQDHHLHVGIKIQTVWFPFLSVSLSVTFYNTLSNFFTPTRQPGLDPLTTPAYLLIRITIFPAGSSAGNQILNNHTCNYSWMKN